MGTNLTSLTCVNGKKDVIQLFHFQKGCEDERLIEFTYIYNIKLHTCDL